jgi:predicted transcriptional regulator
MPVKRKNVHVPLEPELHARLVAQARRVRSPVTVAAREAIAAWTLLQERQAERDAIRAYAEAMAGTEADLDEGLEEAAAADLRDAPG